MRLNGRLLGASVTAFYASSLALPAFTSNASTSDTWLGINVLVFGWMGLFSLQFAWLANLIVPIIVIRLMVAMPMHRFWSAVLLALAFSALLWDSVTYDSGVPYAISWQAGFYCWIAAVLLTALAPLANEDEWE